MKAYKVVNINKDDYKYLVLSTSFETPLTYLEEIDEELAHCDGKYKVIFDLLLSIGNTSERFIEAMFDGESLIKTSFDYIEISKQSELRKLTTQILKENSDLLENSVLNSFQKKMLSKGITI